MTQKSKKKYDAPATMVCDSDLQPIMIPIGSGETIPEDSDTNNSFFEEEEENAKTTVNVWDDL